MENVRPRENSGIVQFGRISKTFKIFNIVGENCLKRQGVHDTQ